MNQPITVGDVLFGILGAVVILFIFATLSGAVGEALHQICVGTDITCGQ